MSRKVNKISIVGAGSFGTALAVVLGGKKYSVTIWAREENVVEGINSKKFNPSYLTDVKLPDSIVATHSLEEALKDSDMVVFATPSHALREVAENVKPFLKGNEIVVSVAKGIEKDGSIANIGGCFE